MNMQRNGHWARSRAAFKHGAKELRTAKRRKNGIILSDACAKGWLAAVEAENALLRYRGVPEPSLPKNFRGQKYLLQKYSGKELAAQFGKLWAILHVAGYYHDGLDPGVAEDAFKDLEHFLDQIESHLK